ncbi:bacterial transcriptional activator domain-containing protein [Micromonospora sp. NPDC047738]|uniref:bacterial transcriptional activator domain-containing protein n=1 Tax=Micromonospora sp. NPDC047738 TaxID=3155741 RepID=UPI0033C5465F
MRLRWPRQVLSLLFVLLLLIGPPAVLLFVVGPPMRGWPTGQQVRAWVEQPLTEQTLAAALTVAAWLVWLVLAYTVTVRALARLRAGAAWLRRMPLPTPLQATASGMAGAAVFTVSANTATAAPPEPALPVAAGTLDSRDDTAHLDAYNSRRDDGVVLSGGWLPRDVADQVAAAAALVWLRRRLGYRPRRPGPPAREDPDLAPLPATATAVQAALADHPPIPQPADVTSGGDGSSGAMPALVSGLPAPRVGLNGAGAAAAARGLLVTALLTARRHPAMSLVVTRTALAGLLGSAAEELRRHLTRLHVVSSVDEAVQVLARTRGHDRHGLDEPRRRDDLPDARATVVLIIDEPPSGAVAQRLAVLPPAAATVVVLGGWPTAATWQVDAAGHTHDPDRPEWRGPRLCVLDAQAATDLLTVIAHTDPPSDQPAPTPTPHAVQRSRPRVPRQATGQDPRPGPAAPGHRLELRVLGNPMLAFGGEPIVVRRTAAMQALVFLAAHPDGADSRNLVDAIWPGLPRHSLTGRLYTTLSELRGTVRAACGLAIVDHTDDRYRLNPDHLDVDLWRFHAAVQHAATAVTNTTIAWQAIIDAYPGDLAAGRPWPWLDPVREATRRHVIDAHMALAAAASDPHHALAVLQQGIRVDPYNADLHVRAMNVLAALGDHDSAAELHDSYTRRLAEAGLEPGNELRETAASLSNSVVPGR